MPVDPQVTPLLEAMAGMAQIDWWSMDPAVMRQGFGTVGPEPEKIEVAKVVDRTIPGPAGEIPVRIYTPEGTGPFPLVAFFHGGGFVLCGLDSHDTLARALCRGAGAIVVSVDYRLAPESKFPAAADDCYAATKWVADHAAELGGDAERLAVAGDSAGGNLSAVTALLAKRKGGPRLVHQLLVYPVTSHEPDTDSYRENAEGYFLTADMMKWFTHHYLRDAKDAKDPLAAPIHATKADLAGLPPATVITAEYDPLRDEGEAYGRMLEDAGVGTLIVRYDGMIHGFVSMFGVLDKGRDAVELCSKRLREAFGA
ncbi:MAG: alpha/beta hydrolase [Myxococcales bacterium]|nr:alpha/beta hydrolase [Myxococcales bacterium]